MEKIKLPEIEPEQASKEIMQFIVQKVKEINNTGCVIGLSGGIDSSVTAALAKKALQDTGMELKALLLPSDINKDTEEAVTLAESLEINYQVLDISSLVSEYNNLLTLDNKGKGNLTARIRANVLSTIAEKENKSVCGTANKDEDYSLGYYTLFGDGAVHFSPLGELSKRLVIHLGSYLGLDTNKTPTAGLEPGQTDFKDLGYSYATAELVIEGKDQGFPVEQLKEHPQVINATKNDIDNGSHFKSTAEIVDNIMQRHRFARKKQEICHPPAAEVTLWY